MSRWLETDWSGLFTLEMSLPEILVRGTLVYLALCLLLRLVLKRQAGKVSLSDLLVVALIAGVCRNPLVRDTQSIPDGLLIVLVVLAWSYALDWLCYHSRFIHVLMHPAPVLLIRDGHILQENLRRELMTENQLRSQLRQQGVADPDEVAEARLEGSGEVSVIRKKDSPQPDPVSGPVPSPGLHNGSPVPAAPPYPLPADDPEVADFLRAVHILHGKLAWHQERINEHRQAVEEARDLLARHGVRLKALMQAVEERPERNGTPHGNELKEVSHP